MDWMKRDSSGVIRRLRSFGFWVWVLQFLLFDNFSSIFRIRKILALATARFRDFLVDMLQSPANLSVLYFQSFKNLLQTMDADSSSSITDSDDDPSPPKTIPKRQGGSATAKNVQKSKPIPEMESSKTMEMVDENTMVYRIYALPSSGASKESSNGGGLITSENLATLQAFAYNLSKDYIWHNEPFRLFRKGTSRLAIALGFLLLRSFLESPTPHFVGQTNFGDNTEDEWFIVYLLYEISKNFPDYIIRYIL